MKFFEEPVVEISRFQMEDVITTSDSGKPVTHYDLNMMDEDILTK